MSRSLPALLLILLAGCGGALADAKGDFKKGRYAEAREELVRVEPEVGAWSDRKRAEYALYRGLTHGALGDRAAAARWLGEAKALENAHPGLLSEDDQARLRLALESVAPDVAPPAP